MEVTPQQLVAIIGSKQIQIEMLTEQLQQLAKASAQPCQRPCCLAAAPEGQDE